MSMVTDAAPAASAPSRRGERAVGWLAMLAWLFSRVAMFQLWAARETYIDHDVRYYLWQLNANGLDDALVEYPTPIVLFLELVRLVSDGLSAVLIKPGGAQTTEDVYVGCFVATMALVDAAATVWLWRGHSRRAAVYWAVFTFLTGSLIWFRIDLLPAIAVLAALVWLTSKPFAAGAAIAVGAATKLWPAMLIGPMLGTGPRERRRGLGFAVVGAILGLGSVLLFGWRRSASPLTWQSDRGLQIESIAATVPMLRHALSDNTPYRTELSQYNAFEIFGPGVDAWQRATDFAMAGCVLLALTLAWLIALGGVGLPGHRLVRGGAGDDVRARTHAVVLAVIAMICAVIVANKTFSPQYVIWLTGPLAVLLALPLPRAERGQANWLVFLGLVTAALTHMVFPLNYTGLIMEQAEIGETVILLVRNLIMVVFTLYSVVLAVAAAWRIGLQPPE